MQDCEAEAPAGFYSKKQVLALTTMGGTTLWREVKAGRFPAAVPLSPNRKGYPRAKVDAWLKAKTEAAA